MNLTKLSLVILSLIALSCNHKSDNSLKPDSFMNPPENVKLHTWWHWLDGNITKEGITKDLEAMKAQGIVQATILNVGLFGNKDFGIKKIDFNTPQWFEMFEWALKEANRLGITIGAHNCDGWSTSGGPWITPETSMKQYTWTKTIIDATTRDNSKLLKPMANHNFYKDVAVVAIRNSESSGGKNPKPQITLNDTVNAEYLNDGCSVSAYNFTIGQEFTFSYENPFTVEKLAILPRRSFMWSDPAQYTSTYSLFSSANGKDFKKIHEFSLKGLNTLVTVPVPKTTSKYFRLVLDNSNNLDAWIPLTIAECELLPLNEKPAFSPLIEHLDEKAGAVKSASESFFYGSKTSENGNLKEVVDLTSKMKSDGTLNWKPAEGSWTVIRFGYTTTGATNGPATASGTGLECDKMDTAALNLHFRNFPAKLIERAGTFAGNTFKFILIDSWECGFQNWTHSLPAEFEKRRGYSILSFIPVLCGESSGSSETDNAVLYDFRKTIADLIENNYYKHFSDLLHQKKMEFHAEVIYGNANYPALDILKTTKYVDLPMYEFWSTTDKDLNLTYYPMNGIELNMPSCAAVGYEKPVMASEAYTGMAHYCESPAGLKPFGDRAYCTGINQMILHSYVHQPNDLKPGMTLGQFGSHFNRNNSYWQYISGWFGFQARMNYVLQQGVAHHDVLYYLGDQLPQYLVYNQSNTLPFGYMFNACNFDILKNRIKISDGKLTLNNKSSYSLLSFPPYEAIDLETLQLLEEMVRKGIKVYAPKPKQLLSYNHVNSAKQQFNELVTKLWGNIDGNKITENSYGKGKVYWGIPIANVLKKEEIFPDITTNQSDSLNMMFIHKKVGDTDVYFVTNQQNKELRREISFKVTQKSPEIWNAEYGSITKPAIFTMDKNYTTIPIQLKPYESLLFVFRNQKPDHYITSVKQNGEILFPAHKKSNVPLTPVLFRKGKEFVAISGNAGNFEFTTNKNKIIKCELLKNDVAEIIDFKGKIDFEPSYPTKIESLNITSLKSFSESENPDIKFFSGLAKYSISFKTPFDNLNNNDSILLDLGKFESIAEVKLNGKTLERIWKPGKLINAKGLLKNDNLLEISVSNIYRNRFIGDFNQYGKVQNLWTSSPIQEFLNKESPLQSSGLIGPLRLIRVKKTYL